MKGIYIITGSDKIKIFQMTNYFIKMDFLQ